MIIRRKLLAMEGIDGSGKRTQIDLLCQQLEERRVAYARFSFPRYGAFFGRMVARFLNGEFGPLEEVDPHFSALLYAGDRYEAKTELDHGLDAGKVVVTDRYIASNLAHQGARMPAATREAFLNWLGELEYGIYKLPAEELVVYLRLPAAQAQQQVEQKAARDYTQEKKDLQEANLQHLEEAARVYDHLANQPHWVTVECFDTARGTMRPPEEIHEELMKKIETQAAYLLRRERQRKA